MRVIILCLMLIFSSWASARSVTAILIHPGDNGAFEWQNLYYEVQELAKRTPNEHFIFKSQLHGEFLQFPSFETWKWQEGDVVNHLFISTHGNLKRDETEKPESTSFEIFGSVTNEGPDQTMQSYLQELVDRMSPTATVIFAACSTLCETDADQDVPYQRLEALMRYLKIPQGRVWGAVRPLYTTDLYFDSKSNIERFGLQLMLATSLSFSLGAVLPTLATGMGLIDEPFTVMKFAVPIFFGAGFIPQVFKSQRRTKDIGRLIIFEDSKFKRHFLTRTYYSLKYLENGEVQINDVVAEIVNKISCGTLFSK